MLNFHIITIFPEMFDSYLSESILKRALNNKKISVKFYNPKNFLKVKTKKLTKFNQVKIMKDGEKENNINFLEKLDDRPFGGGPGMVLRAEPFLLAIKKALGKKKKYQIIYFSPQAEKFKTTFAKKIAQKNKKKELKDIILVAGRYEGIDSRVEKIYPGEKLSIGDYVLTGGEIPAMILIDSISRQVEGVLGNFKSLEEERISSDKFYTRPEILKWPLQKGKKIKVPEVLLSGNHKKIEEWKKNN